MESNQTPTETKTVGTQTENHKRKNSRAKSTSPTSNTQRNYLEHADETFEERVNKSLEVKTKTAGNGVSSRKKKKTSSSPSKTKARKPKVPAFKNYEDYLRKTFNKNFHIPESDRGRTTDRKTRSAPTTPLKLSSKSVDFASSLPLAPKRSPSKTASSSKQKEVVVLKYKTIDTPLPPSFSRQHFQPIRSQQRSDSLSANLSSGLASSKEFTSKPDMPQVSNEVNQLKIIEILIPSPEQTSQNAEKQEVLPKQTRTPAELEQSTETSPPQSLPIETVVQEERTLQEELPSKDNTPRTTSDPPKEAQLEEPIVAIEQKDPPKEAIQVEPATQEEKKDSVNIREASYVTTNVNNTTPRESILDPTEAATTTTSTTSPSPPEATALSTTSTPHESPREFTPTLSEQSVPPTPSSSLEPSLTEEERKQQIRDSISRKLSLSDSTKRVSAPPSPSMESVKDKLIKKTQSLVDISSLIPVPSSSLESPSEPIVPAGIQVSEGAMEKLRTRLGRRGSLSDITSLKPQVVVQEKPTEDQPAAVVAPADRTESLRIQLAKKLSLSEVTRSTEKKEEGAAPAVSESAMQALKARMARRGSVELTKSDIPSSPRGATETPPAPVPPSPSGGPPPPPPPPVMAPPSPLSISISKRSAPSTPQSRSPFLDPMDELKMKLKSMPLRAQSPPDRARSASVNPAMMIKSPRLPQPVVDNSPPPQDAAPVVPSGTPPPPPMGMPPPPPPLPLLTPPKAPSSSPLPSNRSSVRQANILVGKARPSPLPVGSLQDELKLKLKDVQTRPNLDEEIAKKKESNTPRGGMSPLPLAELKLKLTQRNQTQGSN